MKRNFILSILLISSNWAIGLQGLVIPQNASILSTAGTGIAGDIHPALNPAMNISSHSYMQYSYNTWLGDIKGGHTLFRWGSEIPKQLSIQTWNAKNLELWGDKPEERLPSGLPPLGTFGVHYVSAAYSMSHNFNTPYRFGFRLQTNYSHLFTESLFGITLDVGTTIPIGTSITLGGVIRNLGYEYNNNLRAELPVESGMGAAIKLPIIKASIPTDLLYSSSNGQEVRAGISTNWKWMNINAGTSISKNRNAKAMGFSLNYRRWKINYGIYFHETAVLGIPQFLDVRLYL